MATKISKGARLHLLRAVERLQYPMIVHTAPDVSPVQRKAILDAMRAMSDPGQWVLPFPSIEFEPVVPKLQTAYAKAIERAERELERAILGRAMAHGSSSVHDHPVYTKYRFPLTR